MARGASTWNTRWLLAAASALACGPALPIVQTFIATTGMQVRLELAGSCEISASDLSFGAYNAASAAPAFAQSTIQLLCAPGMVAELALDAGTAPGASTTLRQMLSASGADRLDYGLYQDAGRSITWGDTPGVDTLEVPTNGALQTVPVFGRIPAGQRPPAGIYGDEITVRVLY